MITEPPIMDDEHVEYYMFVPMLATLYGRDAYPRRFLRVVPGHDLRMINTMYDDPSDASTLVVVETTDMENFLRFTTYGYSPYAECAMSGLPNGIDFAKHFDYLVSQATLRHYRERAHALFEICKSKRLSISGRMTSTPSTSELVDELDGALCLWEMLMNMGQLRPKECLRYAIGRKDYSSIPFKKFRDKIDALDERMAISAAHPALRYKITSEKRDKLLRSFS